MEIILGILIVLVIAAIVALLVLKKKQQALDSTPSASPLVRPAQREPSVAKTDSNPALDSALANASNLITAKRFDEAGNELRTLFMTNPKNSQVALKLLQVYALTGNTNAFDQLYQRLKEFGDIETVKEAGLLEIVLHDNVSTNTSLFNETQAQSQPDNADDILNSLDDFAVSGNDTTPFSSSDKSAPDDFSAFNFDADDTPSTTPNKTDNTDFGVDLDGADQFAGLEDFSVSTPAPAPVSASDEFGLDLDFGTPAPATQPTTQSNNDFDGLDFGDTDLNFNALAPAPTPVADDNQFDGLDFGFETPAPTPAPVAEPVVEKADDFSFDLDGGLSGFETPAPTPAPAVVESNSFDDLDFGFETPAPAPTPAPEPVVEQAQDFGDLDFGFETPAPTPAPVAEPVVEKADDFSFDLDGGLSGFETPAPTPAPAVVESNSFDDLDFGFETPAPTPAPEPVVEQAQDFGDLDFGFETPAPTPAPEPVVEKADDFSFDLDGGFGGFETPAPTPAPAVVESNSFDDLDFGFETPTPAPTPAPEPVVEQAQDFGDLDFGFETPAPTPAPEPVVEKADDFSFDLDAKPAPTIADELDALNAQSEIGSNFISPSLDGASTLARTATALVSEPVLAPTPIATSDSSFGGELDGAQITLDLAKNYLNLGEHGSAKRLLAEVLMSGDASQQQQAQMLLNRLA